MGIWQISYAESTNDDVILDEAFLLFLADSVEDQNQLLDPLSMVEDNSVTNSMKQQSNSETNNETTDNKEASHE